MSNYRRIFYDDGGSHSIKPVETMYKGYRFRSRLEARWAVFFDEMDFDWIYEPEGFHLDDGALYLPDFQLLPEGPYVEVKPTQFTAKERRKVELFSRHKAIILLVGIPRPIGYEFLEPRFGLSIALFYHDDEPGNWELVDVGQIAMNDKLENACFRAKVARFEW